MDSWAEKAPAADNDDDSNVDIFGTKEEKKADERAAKVKSSCNKKESLSSSLHDGVVSRRVMDSHTWRKLFSATPATSVQAFGSMAPPVNKVQILVIMSISSYIYPMFFVLILVHR